jgi:hypothetical protein
MSHPDATPPLDTIEQDARLAYQAYRDALHLAFPMDWERVPAATQQAWRAVVLAMREKKAEPIVQKINSREPTGLELFRRHVEARYRLRREEETDAT